MSAQRYSLRPMLLPLVAAGALAAGAAGAQHMPADLDAASGARLPYLTRQDLGAEGQRLADIFARDGQPSDPISGPLAFASYNIPVANALLDLHDGAVGKGTLDAHARELAIMVACRETNYTLEWNGHLKAALDAGVDQKVIDVIQQDKGLDGLAAPDAAIVRFGRELLRDRRMSSETFAKAVELFGEHGAMDLVAVMGTYAVSGFYAIAVNEHPPGQPILEPLGH
jgi:4-carboxymuconolactone decarboxylase